MTTIHQEYPIPDDGRPYHERYRPAVHFRSREHEFSSVKLGMWLFLTTEVLLFAGMFCAYAVFRMLYPQAFANGSHYLDWRWGSLNTVILLISSFTVAMSIHNAQKNQQFWLRVNLSITLVCALAFLLIKFFFEYMPKWAEGKRPGALFRYPYASDPYEHIWWSVYYVSTGIHALHVVIGAAVLSWVLYRAFKRHFGPTHYNAVEVSGLYWHLVDMIWIFLFPLLYLIH